MQKEVGTHCKVFQKALQTYQQTTLNFSYSRNRLKIPHKGYNKRNQTGQVGNKGTRQLLGTRETVGSPLVQQTGISAFKLQGIGTMQRKLQDAKAADTDEEIDEQELEAHYSFMAKIQEVLLEESSSTEQLLEHKCADERVALANLIANLTLDTEENKMILKQLKKANASLTQELEECKTNLDETSRALGEDTSCRDSCLIALQNKQNELEKYIAFNDRTIDFEILQTKFKYLPQLGKRPWTLSTDE
ncbi:hypothetical protein Tco_0347152 [Tanacetum coccineum]